MGKVSLTPSTSGFTSSSRMLAESNLKNSPSSMATSHRPTSVLYDTSLPFWPFLSGCTVSECNSTCESGSNLCVRFSGLRSAAAGLRGLDSHKLSTKLNISDIPACCFRTPKSTQPDSTATWVTFRNLLVHVFGRDQRDLQNDPAHAQ
jgi:hypothetical protein